jgi:hypothetical protein
MFNRVFTKASEGEQQQLLLLQVPASDNENDEMTNSQTTAYNASLDHQYLNEENQAVFLSSNAIPVTTCVTVTSDDQVLEVQIEQDPEEQEQDLEQDQDMAQEEEDKEVVELEEARITDEEQDYANHENDNETKVDDETNEAVNNISGGETPWNITNDGVIVVNQSNYKRKIMSIDMPKEEGEEVMELEDT